MNQIDFLNKIEENIENMYDTIFDITIVNMNSGIEQDEECIDKTSSEWRIFISNFNKYFELFPNDIRKEEMKKLTSESVIDNKWIENAKVFINDLKNDIIS